MLDQLSIYEKLEYLVKITGKRETEVLAEALEEGMAEIYRKQISSAYLSGEISREDAAGCLGGKLVQELDYARESITHDIKWGLSIE